MDERDTVGGRDWPADVPIGPEGRVGQPIEPLYDNVLTDLSSYTDEELRQLLKEVRRALRPDEPQHDVVVKTAKELPEVFLRDATEHPHPGVLYHLRLGIYAVVLDEIDPEKLARKLLEAQRELGLTRERLAKAEKEIAHLVAENHG